MDISKKDWKLFQEKLPSWQENYMQKLVKEYAEYLNDDTKKPSERFWWMGETESKRTGIILELSLKCVNRKLYGIWSIL